MDELGGLCAHRAVLSPGTSGTFSPSRENPPPISSLHPLLQPLAPLISSRFWICLFRTFIEMELYSRAGFFTQQVFRVHLFENFLSMAQGHSAVWRDHTLLIHHQLMDTWLFSFSGYCE